MSQVEMHDPAKYITSSEASFTRRLTESLFDIEQ